MVPYNRSLERKVREMNDKLRNNMRRIGVLKRVLKQLAHLPETPEGLADRLELEDMIREMGGDERTGAHVAIRDSKKGES